MTTPTEVLEAKERPILFSGPMVRALLDGRKTQTRRTVKPRRGSSLFALEDDGSPVWTDSYIMDPGNDDCRMRDNPYGKPGDRLWVREAWAPVPATAYRHSEGIQQVVNPDDPHLAAIFAAGWDRSIPKWKPSIHMPRWACRLVLEITDVRVERLNAISEADAMAEGIARFEGERFFHWEPNPEPRHPRFNGVTPEAGFQFLWETINGDGSWDANPWVWAVSFRVIPNPSIDNGAADAARA